MVTRSDPPMSPWLLVLTFCVYYHILAMEEISIAQHCFTKNNALCAMAMDIDEQDNGVRKKPSIYIKNRPQHYKITVFNMYDDSSFKQTVRFTRHQFFSLVSMLDSDLKSRTPAQFRCIPNREMESKLVIAIALRRLSSGDNARSVAKLFGVSAQTVGRCTNKFVKALLNVLRPLYLKWPTVTERQIERKGFEEIQGFKNCIGAIDCTHVYMKLFAKNKATDYCDRTGFFSTVMQAVVDSKMGFLNVAVGFPGSIHDTRIINNTSFWRKRATLFNGPMIHLPGSTEPISEYIVGDAGYTLSQYIMIPLSGRQLNDDQELFNKKHSQTHIVVERTFGRWKQTWAMFDSKVKRPVLRRLYEAMVATCVLHNMLVECGEIYEGQEDPGFEPEVFDGDSTDSDESFSDHEAEESESEDEELIDKKGVRQRGAMLNYIKTLV